MSLHSYSWLKKLLISSVFFLASASVIAQVSKDGTTTPDLPEMQALAMTSDALDAAKQIAEDSGFPLPPGALDGAKSTDLMYQTLKMILGQPIANITQFTTNQDPEGNSLPVKNVNVIVFLFSMMAGIGLIATLIASIWTILQSLVSINTSAKLFSNNNGQGSPFAFLVSRMGSSSILNAPIPAAGGMALSQVIMIFMALLGIGLGSQLFYFVASRMIDQPLITYSSKMTETFFLNAAKAQLCLDFLESNEFIKPEQNVIQVKDIQFGINAFDRKFMFGDKGQCGSFKYEFYDKPTEVTNENTPAAARAVGRLFANGSGENIEAYIIDKFKPKIADATSSLLNNAEYRAAIRALMTAEFTAEGYTPSNEVMSGLGSAYSEYKQAIAAAFAELGKDVNQCNDSGSNLTFSCSNEVIKKTIAEAGFMLAGTYSYVLNERQSIISNAIETSAAEFEYDDDSALDMFSIWNSSSYKVEYRNRMNMLDTTFTYIATTSTDSLGQDLNSVYEATTSDGMIMEALGDVLYDSMRAIVKVGYAGQNASFENPEPITQLSQIGNVMMALPLAVVALDSMASSFSKAFAAGKILDAAGDLSDMLDKKDEEKEGSSIMKTIFAMLFASMLQAIVVGGFFLAVFVPAIPYVMWNMAIFGYIAYVMLCIIGVPIMVAAKPLNDGDGFIGGVKTGYMMAFTIFIRPAAMVTGLVLAMVLSRVFSWIINATYFESMQLAHSNGFSLAAFIGVPLMYVVIQLTAIYKAYSMINEVPAFIGKMTETDRAHTDFGEESERNRVGGLFIQGGQSAMGGLQMARKGR